MRGGAEHVATMQQDPALAKLITTELRSYDSRSSGLTDRIAAGLIACRRDHDVLLLVDTIPTL